jgi:NitT/TauT family transport system ATP-binding protein
MINPIADHSVAIKVTNVDKYFTTNDGMIQVLNGISLEANRGEFVSIIGPSGCGKTTFLRILADLEKTSGGEIHINGKSPYDVRLAREFAFVFQSSALLEWRTAIENVMLPLEMLKVDRGEIRSRAKELMAFVGLEGFEESMPRHLSGGMQQRVSIARALTINPGILFMDEPFGALDQITRDRMNLELLRIWKERDLTIVFVTHSIREAVLLSDRILVMTPRPGRVQGIVTVDLDRPRTLDIRERKAFVEIVGEGEGMLIEGMNDEHSR